MLRIKQVELLQDELDLRVHINNVLESTDTITDPDWSGADDVMIPTQLAVKDYVVANFGSGTATTIGLPADANYADGYHDFWTASTITANAFDNLNETLLDIAPAIANPLTGLDLIGATIFSGKLSNSLPNEAQWVADAVIPGDTIATLTASVSITINTPNETTTFAAGNKRNYPSTLIGSVYAWKASGTIIFPGVATASRTLASGAGITGIIETTDISLYNIVNVKANARIVDGALAEGYNQYKISADNAADETNIFKIYYTGASFPNQTFSSSPAAVENTPIIKNLSGIPYYDIGSTFNLSYTANDLYSPIYAIINQTIITADYFTTINKNKIGIPDYNEQLIVTNELLTLTAGASSGQVIGEGTVTLYKPNKSDVPETFTLGDKPTNTMGTDSTIQIEYFHDEDKRYDTHLVQSWDSNSIFSNTEGQLEVQNGKLIDPRHSGNYPSYIETTNYYRRFFSGRSVNIDKGTLTITKSSTLGEASPWLTAAGGKFQITMWIQRTAGWSQYDLGLGIALPEEDGGVGIRDDSDSTNGVIKWALPNGQGYIQPSDIVIIDIKFENTISTDYITELEMEWNW